MFFLIKSQLTIYYYYDNNNTYRRKQVIQYIGTGAPTILPLLYNITYFPPYKYTSQINLTKL